MGTKISTGKKRLNKNDISFLLEMLGSTKKKYAKTDYTTNEFKQQRLSRVEVLEQKLKSLNGKFVNKE